MEFLPSVACNALFYSITAFSAYISSTQNIFKFIVDHKDSDYAVFQHQLETTDLTNKMEITNALIKDVVKRWTNESLNTDEPLITTDTQTDGTLIDIPIMNLSSVPEPIKLATLSVLTVSNKIITVLDTIHCKIKTHQLSYMKSIIKINIKDETHKIVMLTALFNQRLDLLMCLLKIYL